MSRLAITWALLAALCLTGLNAGSDQRDPRLPELFDALRAGDGWAAAEKAIWDIWLESGDAGLDRLMAEGIGHMSGRRLDRAVAVFTSVIDRAPGFAEAWNKRATAHYLRQDLEASVADIRRTLELEPRHFGAIAGLGLVLVRRQDPEGALKAFERVLEVHPHSVGARQNVELLRAMLRDGSV